MVMVTSIYIYIVHGFYHVALGFFIMFQYIFREKEIHNSRKLKIIYLKLPLEKVMLFLS